MISFSETELQCIGNALDRAAERYERNAEQLRSIAREGQKTTAEIAGYEAQAEQFDRQKVECYTLRERLAEVVGW